MALEEYQQLALRTANTALPYREQLAHCAIGLVCEAIEVIDSEKPEGELGDVLWYVVVLCHALDISLQTFSIADSPFPLQSLSYDERVTRLCKNTGKIGNAIKSTWTRERN